MSTVACRAAGRAIALRASPRANASVRPPAGRRPSDQISKRGPGRRVRPQARRGRHIGQCPHSCVLFAPRAHPAPQLMVAPPGQGARARRARAVPRARAPGAVCSGAAADPTLPLRRHCRRAARRRRQDWRAAHIRGYTPVAHRALFGQAPEGRSADAGSPFALCTPRARVGRAPARRAPGRPARIARAALSTLNPAANAQATATAPERKSTHARPRTRAPARRAAGREETRDRRAKQERLCAALWPRPMPFCVPARRLPRASCFASGASGALRLEGNGLGGDTRMWVGRAVWACKTVRGGGACELACAGSSPATARPIGPRALGVLCGATHMPPHPRSCEAARAAPAAWRPRPWPPRGRGAAAHCLFLFCSYEARFSLPPPPPSRHRLPPAGARARAHTYVPGPARHPHTDAPPPGGARRRRSRPRGASRRRAPPQGTQAAATRPAGGARRGPPPPARPSNRRGRRRPHSPRPLANRRRRGAPCARPRAPASPPRAAGPETHPGRPSAGGGGASTDRPSFFARACRNTHATKTTDARHAGARAKSRRTPLAGGAPCSFMRLPNSPGLEPTRGAQMARGRRCAAAGRGPSRRARPAVWAAAPRALSVATPPPLLHGRSSGIARQRRLQEAPFDSSAVPLAGRPPNVQLYCSG